MLAIVNHARRNGRLAHRMADVEALDALHTFGQPQGFAQRQQSAFLRRAIAHPLCDGKLGVLVGHVDPHPSLAVRRNNSIDA